MATRSTKVTYKNSLVDSTFKRFLRIQNQYQNNPESLGLKIPPEPPRGPCPCSAGAVTRLTPARRPSAGGLSTACPSSGLSRKGHITCGQGRPTLWSCKGRATCYIEAPHLGLHGAGVQSQLSPENSPIWPFIYQPLISTWLAWLPLDSHVTQRKKGRHVSSQCINQSQGLRDSLWEAHYSKRSQREELQLKSFPHQMKKKVPIYWLINSSSLLNI